MTAETTTSLTVSRVINGDREAVFKAWTEPEQLKRWSAPSDAEVALAEVDLRVGGAYRIRMRGAEGVEHNAIGTYQEIDRPRRLRYTWQWEEQQDASLDRGHNTGQTLVTVDFTEIDGATKVTVTQELFPNEESRAGHEQGWGSCLDNLETLFT